LDADYEAATSILETLDRGAARALCVEQELSFGDMRSTSPQVGVIDLTKLH
jgi:hypothetical protein